MGRYNNVRRSKRVNNSLFTNLKQPKSSKTTMKTLRSLSVTHQKPVYLKRFLNCSRRGRAINPLFLSNPIHDSILIDGSQFTFPVIARYQITARLLSLEATHEFRNQKFHPEFLNFLSIHHVTTQVAVCGKNPSSCFTTFVIVNRQNRILDIQFAAAPSGDLPQRKIIKNIRRTSFPTQFKTLQEEWRQRKAKIQELKTKLKQMDSRRDKEAYAQIHDLHDLTARWSALNCAEGDFWGPLGKIGDRGGTAIAGKNIHCLSTGIRNDEIETKQFYGNCKAGVLWLKRFGWGNILDYSKKTNEVIAKLTYIGDDVIPSAE